MCKEYSKVDYISLLSHEIKSPIATMSGYSDLIRNGIVDMQTAMKYADNICKESVRLAKLVDDMVYMTKYNANELVPDLNEESWLEIIDSAIRKIEFLYKERVSLDISVKGAGTAIMDRFMIEEVVFKILENSVLYSNNTSLSCGKCDLYVKIKISVLMLNQKSIITISDDGCGMEKEVLSHVFDVCYRADKKYSRSVGCNGMGLTVARMIMNVHGGNIDIESEVKKGTTVTLTL